MQLTAKPDKTDLNFMPIATPLSCALPDTDHFM